MFSSILVYDHKISQSCCNNGVKVFNPSNPSKFETIQVVLNPKSYLTINVKSRIWINKSIDGFENMNRC